MFNDHREHSFDVFSKAIIDGILISQFAHQLQTWSRSENFFEQHRGRTPFSSQSRRETNQFQQQQSDSITYLIFAAAFQFCSEWLRVDVERHRSPREIDSVLIIRSVSKPRRTLDPRALAAPDFHGSVSRCPRRESNSSCASTHAWSRTIFNARTSASRSWIRVSELFRILSVRL